MINLLTSNSRGRKMIKSRYILVASFMFGMVAHASTEATVKTEMQIVKLSDGKQYKVPTNTTYTQKAVTAKAIKFYQSIGAVECKDGDITWEDKVVADKINQIMRTGHKDEGIALYKKAAIEGKVGCSSPLE